MATDPHRFDDLFTEFGPVRVKRFFGGEGLYAGDVMIGMVFEDRIHFKTDEKTRRQFLAEKCKPFQFTKRNTEVVVTGWFALPDRLYDDPEELAYWARDALRVASASPTPVKKPKPATKKKKKKKKQSVRRRK
jgi:DNA transformation protein